MRYNDAQQPPLVHSVAPRPKLRMTGADTSLFYSIAINFGLTSEYTLKHDS